MKKQVVKEKPRKKDRVEISEEETAKERARAYREYEDFAAGLNQISDEDIDRHSSNVTPSKAR